MLGWASERPPIFGTEKLLSPATETVDCWPLSVWFLAKQSIFNWRKLPHPDPVPSLKATHMRGRAANYGGHGLWALRSIWEGISEGIHELKCHWQDYLRALWWLHETSTSLSARPDFFILQKPTCTSTESLFHGKPDLWREMVVTNWQLRDDAWNAVHIYIFNSTRGFTSMV